MKVYSEDEMRAILLKQIQKRGDQKALAKRLGFTAQFINDVLNNRRAITQELANAMGYSRLPPRFIARASQKEE